MASGSAYLALPNQRHLQLTQKTLKAPIPFISCSDFGETKLQKESSMHYILGVMHSLENSGFSAQTQKGLWCRASDQGATMREYLKIKADAFGLQILSTSIIYLQPFPLESCVNSLKPESASSPNPLEFLELD